MALSGKQKRFLRSQAHHLNPIFQVGKGGVNEAMVHQIGEALEKRELIKISLLQNTDETPEEVTQVLEEALKCRVVQTIGKVLVVYKPSMTDKYRNLSLEVNKI
ncbi:ribosome assembly RNA-binding protein YhbY [Enterococcus sp. LJL98]